METTTKTTATLEALIDEEDLETETWAQWDFKAILIKGKDHITLTLSRVRHFTNEGSHLFIIPQALLRIPLLLQPLSRGLVI